MGKSVSVLVRENSAARLSEEVLRDIEFKEAAATEVQNLFSMAAFIELEPGMENDFSEGLEKAIERYGALALREMREIILRGGTASSIALEALKYVGNLKSDIWCDERRLMLEACLLESRSAWVRDGAGLGLSFLDDPLSIPVLEKAIAEESSAALKEDLQLVLDQLKRTYLEE